MAQINLLKQQAAPTSNFWQLIPKLFVRLFSLVLVGLLIYYAWLIISMKNMDSKISMLKVQIQNDQQKAMAAPERKEVLMRQQQLKSLDGIIAQHVYWSQAMPKIAAATLKTATYSSLRITSDGKLALAVKVPTLEDLDKFLEVFDQPDVNKYFSNVRIGGYHNVQDGNSTAISFDMMMDYNPQIIKYQEKK